eukprot:403376463
MSNNPNASQQMLFREQPQPEPQQMQQQKQPEDIKFSKGGDGGDGKPFIAYSSTSSSVQCRTDPENPGQQICKKVTRQSYLDPETGRPSQRVQESEEYRPNSGGFFGGGPSLFSQIGSSFGGSGDDGYFSRGSGSNIGNFENNQQQNKPSIIDKLKHYLNLGEQEQNYQQYQEQQQQAQPYYQNPQFPARDGAPIPPPPYAGQQQDPRNYENEYDRLITRQMNPFRMLEESERQIRSMLGEDFGPFNRVDQDNFGHDRGFRDGFGNGRDIFDEFERELFGGFGMNPMRGGGLFSQNQGGFPGGMNSYQTSWSGQFGGPQNFQQNFEQSGDHPGNNRQQHDKFQRVPFPQEDKGFVPKQMNQQRQQNYNRANQQQNPEQKQETFQIKSSTNPALEGIKFSGKIYDV